MMNPGGTAIGRIVHFVTAEGDHVAAMITGVSAESVNLRVFFDSPTAIEWRCNAVYSDLPTPSTWHFPERA